MLQKHLLLLKLITLIARSFCEGFTRHDVHILDTAILLRSEKPERHVCKASYYGTCTGITLLLLVHDTYTYWVIPCQAIQSCTISDREQNP